MSLSRQAPTFLVPLILALLVGTGLVPAGTAQPLELEQFGLSERSTYVETRESPPTGTEAIRYFSSSERYTLCNDCDTGEEPGCGDCWWAQCDRLLAEAQTLRAMQDYVRELDQPELTQHVKDRESLTALVYNEPEGALQSILPQKRAEWNQIVAGDRERLISLGRYCTPSGGSLVFTFMLNNPGEASVSVTEIVHHRLFDYGEAGGGDPSTPNVFEPEIDYVHDVAFRCEGPEETEAIALPLSPPLRIAPGQASSFELITNYTISGYPGAFLAPIKMRLDIVTSAGTVSTTVFLVEAPSCAG